MHTSTSTIAPIPAERSVAARVDTYDWQALAAELDGFGCAILPKLLAPQECDAIAGLYPQEHHFRSHVIMARHGFGKGEYRYFSYPLPALLAGLRSTLYPRLAGIANGWNERMGIAQRYPEDHASFLKQCHEAGQTRPTPLLLQYVPGDFNCLHQDLYGALAFPIQVAILLSEPGRDFTGGEFVLTEQRPRMQSRAEWCRFGRAMPSLSPFTIALCEEQRETTVSISGMASAGSVPACAIRSASFFTMPADSAPAGRSQPTKPA